MSRLGFREEITPNSVPSRTPSLTRSTMPHAADAATTR